MPTYPLSTLGPTIDATGIKVPSYSDIYQSLVASFQAIYGSDIYIAPDSQDGQWIAIIAQAISDCDQAAVQVFNCFGPTYSQGAQLSSLVKINGLTRLIPTNSTAIGNAVGVAGTIITNGVVQDINGNLWNLPSTVTIDTSGSATVTVTAQQPGTIIALAGSINIITNPQLGWQSFVSTTDAVPGSAVETDAALRIRQAESTALPALSVKDAIFAEIANVPGVQRLTVYENDTGITDVNGVPSHSISAIVEGGDSTSIATAIALSKTPGTGTYGTTTVPITDKYGLVNNISFFELQKIQIYFAITIVPLAGYVSTTGDALKAALVAFIDNIDIGEDAYVSQASAAASLNGQAIGNTFYIATFYMGTTPSPTSGNNVTINYNQAAECSTGNIVLTVS